MKTDVQSELDLLNQNADEMIRLCQFATDAGLWTQQKARRHTARLEALRVKLNADFRELLVLQERLVEARERASRESTSSIPSVECAVRMVRKANRNHPGR